MNSIVTGVITLYKVASFTQHCCIISHGFNQISPFCILEQTLLRLYSSGTLTLLLLSCVNVFTSKEEEKHKMKLCCESCILMPSQLSRSDGKNLCKDGSLTRQTISRINEPSYIYATVKCVIFLPCFSLV